MDFAVASPSRENASSVSPQADGTCSIIECFSAANGAAHAEPFKNIIPVLKVQVQQKSHHLCISALMMASCWSGRRGSNSLPPPWQGGALPDELRPHIDNAMRALSGFPQRFAKQMFVGKRRKSSTYHCGLALQDHLISRRTFDVVPPIGIEPMTRGFSVPCSTD